MASILNVESDDISKKSVLVKLIANMKSGIKSEHLPLAALDAMKIMLFSLSPVFVHNSTMWIFLANTEVIVNYVLMVGSKFNYQTLRGAGIGFICIATLLSLF